MKKKFIFPLAVILMASFAMTSFGDVIQSISSDSSSSSSSTNNESSSVYGFSPAPPSIHHPDSQETEVEKNNTPQQSQTQNVNSVQNKEPKEVTDYISTPNPTNSSVKFYYYIPAKLINSSTPYPLIVTVPGLDGDGQDAVYEELRNLADSKGYAILAPTFKFNQEDFDALKAYQYPQAWSGQALLDMLEKAKSNGLNYSKLYLVGFSAGAQFSSRFSFMKPELIDACALMASGARVKPDKKTNVKYFIGIGTMDDEYRKQNAEIFYSAATKLNIPIEYKKYSVDHGIADGELNDVVNFFEKVRNGQM